MISIIIPILEVKYLPACLAGPSRLPKDQYRIIVVNNGHDRVDFPGVQVINNPQNVGFGSGCNQGARAHKADYYLFLNSDLQISDSGIHTLVSFMRGNPQCGECGPIGRNMNTAVCKSIPIPADTRRCDYVVGACCIVSSAAWELTGGFDPQYDPCFFEDTDLAWAIRKSGKEVWQVGGVLVKHSYGVCVRRDGQSVNWRGQQVDLHSLTFRNMELFKKKWNLR